MSASPIFRLYLLVGLAFPSSAALASDWLHWRGPHQNGVSDETGLPDSVSRPDDVAWEYPIAGRGTPVVASGRVYALGYEGEGKDLQEVLLCLDEGTGDLVWQHRFNDFLSDVIYSRYAIGSPTVDPETGNVYVLSTAGELTGFARDGRVLWQHSMMEEFGRLTFPNGRTGAPVVDGDLVILHVISAHWGPIDGPARDRFYAFDKTTGDVVWESTPGTRPIDSSFSAPFLFDAEDGRRVLYASLGCGNVVCIDARTGDPLWRYPIAHGGMNSSVIRSGDRIFAINGKENNDSSTIGRGVCIRAGARPGSDGEPVVLDRSFEIWRNDLTAFTSSPVLVGDRLYATVATGDLFCVDAGTGATLWHVKLAPDQIHASPAFGDGKLYVPMTNGSFHVIRPADEGPERVSEAQLAGNCLGAPAIANGRVFVHTTERLYCFGPRSERAPDGDIARLQIVPYDLLLAQGDRAQIRVRGLDAQGRVVAERVPDVSWSVRGPLNPVFSQNSEIAIPRDGRVGTGFLVASANGLTAQAKLRVVNALPYFEDFEGIALDQTPPGDELPFGFPPSHWIGARLKFNVVELDGSKVLAKTLDRALFQRAMTLFGTPDMSDYTVQVDIRTDGNRRMMSNAGIVNQRYLIELKGNHQQIEITSNQERIKESVPFRWKPGIWYTLKSDVRLRDDGSGVVRAKAWPRDEEEPDGWLIEVEHRNAHRHGSPGLFGFALQSRFRVYMDNLKVTPND